MVPKSRRGLQRVEEGSKELKVAPKSRRWLRRAKEVAAENRKQENVKIDSIANSE